MSLRIKRLGPGDEATLELLAREDAEFYRGCGFNAEQPQPLYMTRELELPPKKMTSTLLVMRVEQARLLISSGRLSAKVVAARSGFDNPVRMARAFQRTLGVSPSSYRALFGRE